MIEFQVTAKDIDDKLLHLETIRISNDRSGQNIATLGRKINRILKMYKNNCLLSVTRKEI